MQPGLCGTWSETPKTGLLTTIIIKPLHGLKINKAITPPAPPNLATAMVKMIINTSRIQNYLAPKSICKYLQTNNFQALPPVSGVSNQEDTKWPALTATNLEIIIPPMERMLTVLISLRRSADLQICTLAFIKM